MQPRQLTRLLQVPLADRLAIVAEGLEMLAEHVAVLHSDLLYLAEAMRPRGAAIIEAFAEEEAAKALILLDVVRAGWSDQCVIATQLKRFSDHLARCIYAEATAMRPATFREIRRLVEGMKEAYYLDGPNDFDWIYRNQLLSQREQALYVDYEHDEEGDHWVTPATHDHSFFGPLTDGQDLVASLHKLGLLGCDGLEVIATTWNGVVIDDDTHWQEIRKLNESVVNEAHERNLPLPDTTTDDIARAVHRWGFPLTSLDLRQSDTTLSQMNAKRDDELAKWEP